MLLKKRQDVRQKQRQQQEHRQRLKRKRDVRLKQKHSRTKKIRAMMFNMMRTAMRSRIQMKTLQKTMMSM